VSRLLKCYSECRYAECRYAECRYAERRDTLLVSSGDSMIGKKVLIRLTLGHVAQIFLRPIVIIT
jgi:hypothetical protein